MRKIVETIDTPVKGYILPLILVILSGMIVMITQLFIAHSTYQTTIRTSMAAVKAQELAYSGVQIAMAQLASLHIPKKPKKDTTDDPAKSANGSNNTTQTKKPKQDPEKIFLSQILPLLNVFQTYSLTKESDGIDGSISLCLMSEEGKININAIYDPLKNNFIDSYKTIIPSLLDIIEKRVGTQNLSRDLLNFLKERTFPVQDASELLAIPAFASLADKIFFDPNATIPLQSNNAPEQQELFLADIFSTDGTRTAINPWMLSPSLKSLLEIVPIKNSDQDNSRKRLKEALSNYRKEIKTEQEWDSSLKKLYNKPYNTLPKNFLTICSPYEGEPILFSVLVHGTVESVTERIYAVLERQKRVQEKEDVYDITIKRIYWL